MEAQHDAVCLGLMVAALSEPERCAAILHHLRYAASDGLACVAGELGRLVEGRWPRLREGPRRQAVWLARKLARLGAAGAGRVPTPSVLRRILRFTEDLANSSVFPP
jgi:hypothetical protein